MELLFHGGASQVTGTCTTLSLSNNLKIMIDCGGEQDSSLDNKYYMDKIDRLPNHNICVITHSHIDHIALLPLAYKKGKIQRVLSTKATKKLAELLLKDSIKIAIENGTMPLFSEQDIKDTLLVWEEMDNGYTFSEINGVAITLLNSAHILGSSSVFIQTDVGNFLFGSDLGTAQQELMDYPPQLPKDDVDYLFIESTYGNKLHKDKKSERDRLKHIINQTRAKGGKVLIPAFSVGRTQELLYSIKDMNVPIYIDTPLGNKVTDMLDDYAVYLKKKFLKNMFDNSKSLFGDNWSSVNTHSQSLELSKSKEFAVIISASGMLEGGRVTHHFEEIKKDVNSTVCFVGYQAYGTRGYNVQNGLETTQCKIESVGSFSAHADQRELIEYVESLKYAPYKVFIQHGEDEARKVLSQKLEAKKYRTVMPENMMSSNNSIEIKKALSISVDLDLRFTKIGEKEMAPIVAVAIKESQDSARIVPMSVYEGAIREEQNKLNAIFKESSVSEELVANTKESLGDVANKSEIKSISELKDKLKEIADYEMLGKGKVRELIDELRNGENGYILIVNDLLKKDRWNYNGFFSKENSEITDEQREALKNSAIATLLNAIDFAKQDSSSVIQLFASVFKIR